MDNGPLRLPLGSIQDIMEVFWEHGQPRIVHSVRTRMGLSRKVGCVVDEVEPTPALTFVQRWRMYLLTALKGEASYRGGQSPDIWHWRRSERTYERRALLGDGECTNVIAIGQLLPGSTH